MIVRIKHIILVCCLFSFLGVNSQSKSKYIGKTSYRQVSKQEIINQLIYAETIFDDSLTKALQLMENNLLLSIKNNYKNEEALAYQTLGKFNDKLQNYSLAISNYKKGVSIYSNLNNTVKLYELNVALGNSYTKNKQVDESLNYYIKAHTLAVKLNDKNKEVFTSNEVGNSYLKTLNYLRATPYFDDVLNHGIKTQSASYIIKGKIGLGQIAEKKREVGVAEKYYKEAQELAEKNELDNLANTAFNLLTNLYQKRKATEQEIVVQQQAYNYNSSRGNISNTIQNSSSLANTYLEQGREEEAMEVLTDNSILLNDEKNTDVKRSFYKALSTAYEKQGNIEAAKKVEKEYTALVDSFEQLEKDKLMTLNFKNELLNSTQNKVLLLEKDREINEKTIKLLKQEQELKNQTIKRQQTITYILILGLIVILIMAFFIYRNSKQKHQSNQLLELKSLRNQMNPHFIFNSLNSVNSFIAKKDEKSANKYLSEFSKLMREVLEYSQEDFIPLSKEIEILELYLNLEHFRFKNDFDFVFEVDNKIKTDDYQIPPMLLQPFVENAIWHGLRYKKEKGMLKVHFTQKENYVEILISDDGIGREKSKESKTLNQKKMKSTGIKNVKNRLEIIKNVFKKDLEIAITNLNENTKEGTVVKVKLYA